MRSGKKPVNCIPCAKRKVRCDKLQPCSHCKRRKEDVCEYPPLGSVRTSRPEDHAGRIEKLERYIRSVGGDPKEVGRLDEHSGRDVAESHTSTRMTEAGSLEITASTGRLNGKIPNAKETKEPSGERSAIMERDEQITYIESWVPFSEFGFLQRHC